MSSAIYKPVLQNLPANNKVQTASRAEVQRVDTSCGFWMCRSACMQPLATIGVFTGVYSLVSMMTQTLTFYVNSQVTTLERQFGFSSHQTGIILAANDVGFLVCVLFAAHVASYTHIPRSLGVTTIVFGISGIACSLPHFLFGASINIDPTKAGINSTTSNFSKQSAVTGGLCDLFNNTRDPCVIAAAQTDFDRTAQTTTEKVAEISLVIIVIGMALQGFGKAPRLTYSVVYVDDNTAKVNTGFYTGIMIAAIVLGPVSAFLLGGVFSRMYVTLEATQLTPGHPRWIGAWWLGFIVFGILSLVVAIPLFCFPRKLPQCKVKDAHMDDGTMTGNTGVDLSGLQKKHSNEDKIMGYDSEPRTRRLRWKSLLKHAREFLASLYRLVINPVYVCVVISSCFHTLMGAGSIAYFPKYLERIFHLGIHTANYITAGMLLCTSFFGALIGGVATRRYKMTVLACLMFTIVMTGLTTVSHLAALIFKCDQPRVHNWPSEDNSCNSGCGCRNNSYFPVCGGDGRTYYSPCHAGCLLAEHGKIYGNCSCIEGGQATAGTCDYGCSHLYGYVITVGLRLLLATLAFVPKLIVIMRCVPEKDKSMALSVLPFMTSLFGWMLSPIFFGNVIDNACVVWDIKCLTRGRCLLYDNNLFRVNFIGYGGLFLVCAFVTSLIAYVYARKTRCLDAAVTIEIAEDRAEVKPVVNDAVL